MAWNGRHGGEPWGGRYGSGKWGGGVKPISHQILTFDQTIKSLAAGDLGFNIFSGPATINVFLVAGQSNANGTNVVAEWNDMADGVISNVAVWNGRRINPLHIIQSTGHYGSGRGWTLGSGDVWSFSDYALSLIGETLTDVCMCRVTEGGTILAATENNGGSWNPTYSDIPEGTVALLEALETRYNNLVSFCNRNNIILNIRGLLWHQGEADSYDAECSAAYRYNFDLFIDKIRTITGNSDLPIFYGTVAPISAGYSENIERVHMDQSVSALQKVLTYDETSKTFTNAESYADNGQVFCRNNSDLTYQDAAHFDAYSSKKFGKWVSDLYGALGTQIDRAASYNQSTRAFTASGATIFN